ncbi:MAG: hypothetical protein KF819_39000 [Labilithrix sp.]|nr:hypothetical protein [Labilithrix sp.]
MHAPPRAEVDRSGAVTAPPALEPRDEESAPGDVASELRIAVARAALSSGDAPGTDSAIAPRPAQSTRLLDTALDRSGSRLRVYATRLPIAAVRGDVARGIAASGYHVADLSDDADTSAFQRGQSFVVVRYSAREDRTLVSIVELGFRNSGAPPSAVGNEPMGSR